MPSPVRISIDECSSLDVASTGPADGLPDCLPARLPARLCGGETRRSSIVTRVSTGSCPPRNGIRRARLGL